jgi:hypothetical protein
LCGGGTSAASLATKFERIASHFVPMHRARLTRGPFADCDVAADGGHVERSAALEPTGPPEAPSELLRRLDRRPTCAGSAPRGEDERLCVDANGNVILRLKTPRHDGSTHVVYARQGFAGCPQEVRRGPGGRQVRSALSAGEGCARERNHGPASSARGVLPLIA